MGIVEGVADDLVCNTGVPGARPGYSGGPVINSYGEYVGILLGGIYDFSTHSRTDQILRAIGSQPACRFLPFHSVYKVLVENQDAISKNIRLSQIRRKRLTTLSPKKQMQL